MTEIHTTPNTELFRKIYNQIKEKPGTLQMTSWEDPDTDPQSEFYNPLKRDWEPRNCGTTRCVAGWAAHFTAPETGFLDTMERLAEEWGITGYVGDVSVEVQVGSKLLGLDIEKARALFLGADDGEAFFVVQAFAEGNNEEAYRILRNLS